MGKDVFDVIVDYINKRGIEKGGAVKKEKRGNVLSISPLVEDLVRVVDDLMIDSAKFDRGNATAGVRVRVGLMGIISRIKIIRTDILTQKKIRENKKKGGV
jgi:hypothetical protein